MHRFIVALFAFLLCSSAAFAKEPPRNLLEGAYNPYLTLESATITETSNMLILLEYGRIEVHHGWHCQLPPEVAGWSNSRHGMLIGDMTLTLDSLPPDDDESFNLFDAMDPGQDAVLKPVELYYYAASRGPFSIDNHGFNSSWVEFPELDEQLQQQFTRLYLESYGEGWWQGPTDILEQMDSNEYITIANPQYGQLGTPDGGNRYIRFYDDTGELWKLRVERNELDIRKGRFHEFSCFGRPPHKPFFLEERERKGLISEVDYSFEIRHKQASPLSWGDVERTDTGTYTVSVAEPQEFIDFDYALFRSDIAITDGSGTELRWETVDLPTSMSGIRVYGQFEPGKDHKITISGRYNSVINALGNQDILNFTFRPGVNGYKRNPAFTIRVITPADMGYSCVAAAGATTGFEDETFVARWPAGSLSVGVLAHTWTEGIYQSDNYLIRYIVPEDQLGTPEVENSVAGLALWLDLSAEILGKLPVDEWIAVIDPERTSDSVHNPIDTSLVPASSPLESQYSISRLWHFRTMMFDAGQAWFFREPESWHEAVDDYRYFAACREFADHGGVRDSNKERESNYYLHFYRHFPGTAQELIDWRVDRVPGYRITAALLAMDYKDQPALWATLQLLYQRGLETGRLEFDEISAVFLEHENPEFSQIWQSVVLDGELVEYDTELENFPLPGITPRRLSLRSNRQISRKGFAAEMHGNPWVARLWFEQQTEPANLKMDYWRAENCYLFGEFDTALGLLDGVDSEFESTNTWMPDRFILRVLCLKELDRLDEALEVARSRLKLLEAAEGNEDYIEVLRELQAELGAPADG